MPDLLVAEHSEFLVDYLPLRWTDAEDRQQMPTLAGGNYYKKPNHREKVVDQKTTVVPVENLRA